MKDQAAITEEQRTNWNEASAGWAAVQDDFECGAGTVTDQLFELAGLHTGQRVLDVATGHGEPALSAARVVGPSGHVLGVDIAGSMLDIARRRADGLSNVSFREVDLASLDRLDERFDVVLSRFGMMFAADHAALFRALVGLLVPGGTLAAAVWGPQATHLLSTGPAALTERLSLPPPPAGVPTTFSMSDATTLAEELGAAGFTDVTVTELVVPYVFDSVDAYVRFNLHALPPQMVRTARERLGSDDVEITRTIAAAVAPHVRPDGTLPLPSTALVFRATARSHRLATTHTTEDGRLALRFERRLAHAPDKVWRALTEAGELGRWFAAVVDRDLTAGATVRFTMTDEAKRRMDVPPTEGSLGDGTVLTASAPTLLEYTWGEELLRWELTPDGEDGCRLVFTDTLPGSETGGGDLADTCGAWDAAFEVFEAVLDDRVPGSAWDRFEALADAYRR